MTLLSTPKKQVAETLVKIAYCNPFLPKRLEYEQQALKSDFVGDQVVISFLPGRDRAMLFPNIDKLRASTQRLADEMRSKLVAGTDATESELRLYEDTALYLLYGRHMPTFENITTPGASVASDQLIATFWRSFLKDFRHYLQLPGLSMPSDYDPAHTFAIFFQIYRAFSHIYENILGRSMPITRLRAAVWQSIFSHDMRRYSRVLYQSMKNICTLIMGPSGTGKELVARAIGLSGYIPFDARTERFQVNSAKKNTDRHNQSFDLFLPINPSAFSPTLIESELFGHKKGAFTGAVEDRIGWLETCQAAGTVFLDEIGELNVSLQVKLLRVTQFRKFSRVGEATQREFTGKFVAATNRDLEQAIASHRFREDLYFRLCADVVHTPTLSEQINDTPEDLEVLARYIARVLIEDMPEEADDLAREAVEWIHSNIKANYPWSGNFRELEQCICNIMVRKSYLPTAKSGSSSTRKRNELGQKVAEGRLTLDSLVAHYASMALTMDGTYERAAKRLDIDWRTLKQKVNLDLVVAYRDDAATSQSLQR